MAHEYESVTGWAGRPPGPVTARPGGGRARAGDCQAGLPGRVAAGPGGPSAPLIGAGKQRRD